MWKIPGKYYAVLSIRRTITTSCITKRISRKTFSIRCVQSILSGAPTPSCSEFVSLGCSLDKESARSRRHLIRAAHSDVVAALVCARKAVLQGSRARRAGTPERCCTLSPNLLHITWRAAGTHRRAATGKIRVKDLHLQNKPRRLNCCQIYLMVFIMYTLHMRSTPNVGSIKSEYSQ